MSANLASLAASPPPSAATPPAGSPAAYVTPPTPTLATSANSAESAKTAAELSKLQTAMMGMQIPAIFNEYDAYRAFQKKGKRNARPDTTILDAERVKLAGIDLQAAFKGLAMIANKNYTRTTPGAPFAAVGPMANKQAWAVKKKNAALSKFTRFFSRGSKGGRRSVTRRHRQRR
jgi:hypothetical protein